MLKKLDKISIPIAIGLNLIAILILYSKADSGQYFIYSLDDPYIHLDIAQNIVEDGNYGVNPGEFSSPSSSPVWTILLAGSMKIFGNNDKLPFFINLFLFPFSIYLISSILKIYKVNRYTWIFLSFVSIAISIPTLTVIGMEHILQIILVLSLFILYKKSLQNSKISFLSIVILLLIPLVRYESIFFSSILALALLRNGQIKNSLLFFVVPFISVSIFGFYSISNDYHFFPNSLLLKGNLDFSSFKSILLFIYYGIRKIVEDFSVQNIFSLLALSMLASIYFKKFNFDVLICILLIISHALFARFGWMYRYEAYIVALSLPIIIGSINELKPKFDRAYNIVVLTIILLFIPQLVRSFESYNTAIKGIRSVNAQHIQFSKFIKENYIGKTIALNDIGAVGYYCDNSYILDLFGLSNIEVANAKRNGTYNKEFIKNILTKYDPKLIITYRSWFVGPNKIPEKYKLAYQWELEIDTDLGDYLIEFYVQEEDYDDFIKKMDNFNFIDDKIYKRKINVNR